MSASEIICVGTELLLGEVIDTNSSYLGKTLSSLGIDIFYKTAVGDNPDRIKKVTEQALKRSDIIIICGGLGPTEDDLTRREVADALGVPLVFHEELLREIKSA